MLRFSFLKLSGASAALMYPISTCTTEKCYWHQINQDSVGKGWGGSCWEGSDICSGSQHSLRPTSKAPTPLGFDALMFAEQLCSPPRHHVDAGDPTSDERGTSFRSSNQLSLFRNQMSAFANSGFEGKL